MDLSALIPVALIALVLYALVRWAGAAPWHLAVAVILGVILTGTILGPDIQNILSQLSGGHLH
jgi:hypothetical protein